MAVRISRRGARTRAAWTIALWLVAGVAAPAAATPVTLFFNEPSGFGVLEDDALASGVPIVRPSFVGDVTGILSGISQEPQFHSLDPFPPNAASGNTATSIWTVQNVSTTDLLGETYLLLVTSVEAWLGGHLVEYDDANVGLSVDPDVDLNWVIVHTGTEPGEGYYYPAVKLGSLPAGASAAPFAMNFVLNEPIQQVGNTFVLPRLQAGLGFQPIPEPRSSVLVGLGLVWLAMACRRPS